MGTPGAGKGTQAKLLAGRFGAVHISTGDMLRAAVQNGSKLGKEARRYLDQGLLVPDEVVVGLVEERLGAPDAAGGFILDGFPRTVPQAEQLDAMLARHGNPLDAVLHIVLPQQEALARLASRRTCQQCGAMFQLASAPERCDRCGGTLGQRDDDQAETARRRMQVYDKETAPVLGYYRGTGSLREVPGSGTPDEVFGRMSAGVTQGRSKK
jgi:adenylate kinase